MRRLRKSFQKRLDQFFSGDGDLFIQDPALPHRIVLDQAESTPETFSDLVSATLCKNLVAASKDPESLMRSNHDIVYGARSFLQYLIRHQSLQPSSMRVMREAVLSILGQASSISRQDIICEFMLIMGLLDPVVPLERWVRWAQFGGGRGVEIALECLLLASNMSAGKIFEESPAEIIDDIDWRSFFETVVPELVSVLGHSLTIELLDQFLDFAPENVAEAMSPVLESHGLILSWYKKQIQDGSKSDEAVLNQIREVVITRATDERLRRGGDAWAVAEEVREYLFTEFQRSQVARLLPILIDEPADEPEVVWLMIQLLAATRKELAYSESLTATAGMLERFSEFDELVKHRIVFLLSQSWFMQRHRWVGLSEYDVNTMTLISTLLRSGGFGLIPDASDLHERVTEHIAQIVELIGELSPKCRHESGREIESQVHRHSAQGEENSDLKREVGRILKEDSKALQYLKQSGISRENPYA